MGLTGAPDVHRLLTRALDLNVPNVPRRRSATDAAFRSALSDVQAELAEIDRYATDVGTHVEGDDEGGDDAVTRARIDLCLELASLLFAARRPAPALAVVGVPSGGSAQRSGRPAVRRGVGSCRSRRRSRRPASGGSGTGNPAGTSRVVAGQHLAYPARLLESTMREPGATGGTTASTPCGPRSYAASPRRTTWNRATRCGRSPTSGWTRTRTGSSSTPAPYPDFEPELNAAAALAGKAGWKPSRWPSAALRL